MVGRNNADTGIARRGSAGDLSRPVGRAIVGHHDLEQSFVILPEDVLERLANPRLFVVRSDQDGYAGIIVVESEGAWTVADKRRDELHVEVAGHDRDPGDHDDGEREADDAAELLDPPER